MYFLEDDDSVSDVTLDELEYTQFIEEYEDLKISDEISDYEFDSFFCMLFSIMEILFE